MSDPQILVIVIDPQKQTIEADTIDDNLTSMQKMLGGHIERVEAPLGDPSEVLWIDEEGKLKENHHFHVKGFPDIIAGKAFICREVYKNEDDGYGNADTDMDAAAVQDLVQWLPHLDGQQLL